MLLHWPPKIFAQLSRPPAYQSVCRYCGITPLSLGTHRHCLVLICTGYQFLRISYLTGTGSPPIHDGRNHYTLLEAVVVGDCICRKSVVVVDFAGPVTATIREEVDQYYSSTVGITARARVPMAFGTMGTVMFTATEQLLDGIQ